MAGKDTKTSERIIKFKAQFEKIDDIGKWLQEAENKLGANITTAMASRMKEFQNRFKVLAESVAKVGDEPTRQITSQLGREMSSLASLAKTIADTFSRISIGDANTEKLQKLAESVEQAQNVVRSKKTSKGVWTKKLVQDEATGKVTLSDKELGRLFKQNYAQRSATVGDRTYGGENGLSVEQFIADFRADSSTFLSSVNGLQTLVGDRVTAIQKQIELYTKAVQDAEEELKNAKLKYKEGQATIAKGDASDNAFAAQGIKQASDAKIAAAEHAQAAKDEAEAEREAEKAKKELANATKDHSKAQKENNTIIGKAAKQVFGYQVVVNLFKRTLSSAVDTVTKLDSALTNMAVVTTMSREESWKLVGSFQQLAAETGKTTTEIAQMATKFYQQGKSTTQVLKLTEAAAKAATIAGIDGSQSIDLLTNALNGFQMSASQALEVSDKFAALAAASATDYEELATALSKVAAQANLAGMSMDFTLGMLAKGIEVTREAPETIGTALKTVISRMRELTDYGETLEEGMDVNRVETALQNVGVALRDANGQFRDLESVLTELGGKWDTLNTNQQANVAVALAGTRQQSRLIAMMQDFDRTLELVDISTNSYGATLAQQAKYMEGLEASTTLLTNAWEQFITSVANSDIFIGALNTITSAITFATENMWMLIVGLISYILYQGISSGITAWRISLLYKEAEANKDLKEETRQATLATILNDSAKVGGIPGIWARIKVLKKDTTETNLNTAAQIANQAAAIGWIVALVALGVGLVALTGFLIGSAIAAAAHTATIEENIEAMKQLQVELYNLSQQAKTIGDIGDEFETLSNKINKTADDISRLNELMTQFNDTVGFELLNSSMDASKMLSIIRAQEALVEKQMQLNIQEQAKIVQGKNANEIADFVNTADGAATLKSYLSYESSAFAGASDLTKTIIMDQLSKGKVDFGENGFQITDITGLYTEETIKAIDEAVASGKATDYLKVMKNQGISKAVLDDLRESGTMFDFVDKVGDIGAQNLDKMGLTPEQLEELSPVLMGLIDNESTKGIFQTEYNTGAELLSTIFANREQLESNTEEDLQKAKDDLASYEQSPAYQQLLSLDNKKDNLTETEQEILQKRLDEYSKYTDALKEAQTQYEITQMSEQEFINTYFNIKPINEWQDSITSTASTIEKFRKLQQGTLDDKDYNELVATYPDLVEKMKDGILSAEEAEALIGKTLNTASQSLQDDLDKVETGYRLKFDNWDEMKDMTVEQVTELGEEQLAAWRDYWQREDMLSEFKETGAFSEEDWEKIGKNTGVALAKAQYKYYTEEMAKYDFGSENYEANAKNAVNALSNQIYNAQLDKAKAKADIDAAVGEGNWEIIDGQKFIKINNELKAVASLTDQEKQQYANILSAITDEMVSAYSDSDEAIKTGAKDMAQFIVDTQKETLEQEKELLEQKKESYEEYFDAIDKLEEEQERTQSREDIMKQMSALSTGMDGASKEKIKELQSQLNELNEEEKEARREAAREAALASIDEETERLNGNIETLDGSIQTLTKAILDNDWKEFDANTNPSQTLSDVLVALARELNVPGYDQGGLVNYTGLAMVHGSPDKPEAFLSAQDTELISFLLEGLSLLSDFDSETDSSIENTTNNSEISIGQINITTEELNNNQDFASAGNALAREFAKVIQERGININVKK